MIKTVAFIILFILGSANSMPIKDVFVSDKATVYLSSDSYLKIKGKTNVSTFECQFNMARISNAIRVKYKDENKAVTFDDAKLTLPNLEFNCGGNAINKDFNKLLNTEEHPEIVLKLKKITKANMDSGSITATIEITISNIVRTYNIPISITQNTELNVNGVMPLNINDFNLEAPTKMLGMVKVSPEIEIHFSLKISEA